MKPDSGKRFLVVTADVEAVLDRAVRFSLGGILALQTEKTGRRRAVR